MLDFDPDFKPYEGLPEPKRDSGTFWGWLFIAFVVFATFAGAVIAFLAATAARAHEAPTGWSFDISCCSNRDCGEVPADWITEGQDGITVVPTGEQISYGDTRIKDSPDGQTYWCRPPGIEPHTICVYLPPKGF